ncbi:MAG: alkaline phosphatase family protein [Candidatus Kariarchaeaceae archaeon]
MTLFDTIDLKPRYLSEEFGLIRPHHDRSVAGVLPELALHMNGGLASLPESFSRLPQFKRKLDEQFPSGYQNLVFLICDALGVQHLQQMGGMIWDNISTVGTVASTVFPSMTVTAMTSISYGKLPSLHGMVGYCTYNEKLDTIYNGLNLLAHNGESDYVVLDKVEIPDLVNGDPLIEVINQKTAAEVTFFTPAQLVSPGLDDVIIPNLERSDYTSPEEAIGKVMHQLSQESQQIVALYLPYADHFGHQYGPDSEAYVKAVRGIEQIIGAILQHPKVTNGSTAVALTSDHGQSQINHDISKWLTREEAAGYSAKGVELSTSGRVLHAYCREDTIDTGRDVLETLANGRGLVIDQDTAIDLAGGHDSDQIRGRMGDYLLVMEDGYLVDVPEVVQYGEDVRLHGQHGSLTAKELYVPVGLFGGSG